MAEGRPSILIVDDLDEHRDLLAQVLSDLGYEVEAAPNGRVALARLHAGPPVGLVLLDLLMPVMDGVEFLSRLRNDADAARAATPVVLMTADATAAEEDFGGAAPDHMLAKPFGLRELRQVVLRFCGQGAATHRAAPRPQERA